MFAPFLPSDWGFFLIAIPFLCLLPASLLRLDAKLASAPRHPPVAPAFGRDADGRLFFTDPDGRPWYPARHARSNGLRDL